MMNMTKIDGRVRVAELDLWHAEGAQIASAAEIAAFVADVNAIAREHAARDIAKHEIITRATEPLPPAFVGVRLVNGDDGGFIASQTRTEAIHPQPCAGSVICLHSQGNFFNKIFARDIVSEWAEPPLDRYEAGASDNGLLDILVYGGVVKATAFKPGHDPVTPS